MKSGIVGMALCLGKSCITNLIAFFESIDKRGEIDKVYLEFIKAFDKISMVLNVTIHGITQGCTL